MGVSAGPRRACPAGRYRDRWPALATSYDAAGVLRRGDRGAAAPGGARQALLAALDDGWADPAQALPRRPAGPASCSTRPGRRSPRCWAYAPTRSPSAPAAPRRATWRCWASCGRGGGPATASCTPRSSTPPCCTRPGARRGRRRRGAAYRWTALGRVDAWALRRGGRASRASPLAALISASHEVGTVQPVAEVAAAAVRAAGVPLHRGRRPVAGPAAGPGGLVGADRPARTSGAGRRASGCSWCAGHPRAVSPPPAASASRPVPGRPAAGRGRRGGAAGGAAEATAEAARLRRAGRPDPRHGRRDRARTSRSSATRSTGCRTWSRSPACTSTARRCCTRWTGAASPSRRGSSCTSSTLRPSHVLEAMGVLSHGNVRVSLHRTPPRTRSTGSWPSCRASWPTCAPRPGWRGCDHGVAGRCSTAAASAARCR